MRRRCATDSRAIVPGRVIAAATAVVAALATPAASQEHTADPPVEMATAARDFWDSAWPTPIGEWLAARLEARPPEERPEWLLMFADILRGSQLNAEDGWFGRPTGGSRFGWDEVRDRLDRDGDGLVAPGEWAGTPEDFDAVDADDDGLLTVRDFEWPDHALAGGPGVALDHLADADGNGKVTRDEFNTLFDRLDEGGLGFLSLDELKGLFDQGTMARVMMADGIKGGGPAPEPGGPSRSTLIRGLFTQEIGSLWPGPDVGDPAPDFTVATVDGDRDVTFSGELERQGRPMVLIFGNFTCGPFRSQAGNLEKLYRRYRDRAGFLFVYVREAHPADGWHMFDNFRRGYTLPQPKTFDQRVDVARRCRAALDLEMPMVVDGIHDPVGTRYSGMPARLYLIDRDGRVAFKSGRGPFGFKPAELEQALALLLSIEGSGSVGEEPRPSPVVDADAPADPGP